MLMQAKEIQIVINRRTPAYVAGQRAARLAGASWLPTADRDCGMNNLATRPRDGNLSSDMRAGRSCGTRYR